MCATGLRCVVVTGRLNDDEECDACAGTEEDRLPLVALSRREAEFDESLHGLISKKSLLRAWVSRRYVLFSCNVAIVQILSVEGLPTQETWQPLLMVLLMPSQVFCS